MMTTRHITSILPIEYDIFFGLDVDKMSMAVTVLDHKKEIKAFKMPYSAEKLINYTTKHFQGKRVAFVYEAGPTGYGLYDSLTAAGYTCIVTTPSMVPKPSGRRVKTNRIDSRQLAVSLRGGELEGIRVPSRKYRDLRHLVHLYKTTIRQSVHYKCRIKALFLAEGMAYPNTSSHDHWSNNTIKKLESYQCNPVIRFKLDRFLENLRFCRTELLAVKRQFRSFCRQDADLRESIELLRSIPGIGCIISVLLLARIGDWRLLRNVRELGAFIGLVPCEHSTGESVRRGNITRLGDSYLRNMLIEGAWTAAALEPQLREFYQKIYKRHPRDKAARKAIVAVTRKLTTRVYAVLTERRPYRLGHETTICHNRKRGIKAPKDDSTLRRTYKYKQNSVVLSGSLAR